MRLLFTIQYLGTRYGGWQSQTNATGVQQVIEEALARIFKSGIRLHAAGRTDAGVHALAQRAHADVPFAIPPRGLLRGVNDLLPDDVRVNAVEEVPESFHARFSAAGKRYDYRIWNDEVADVFHAATHAHVTWPLDLDSMRRAAEPLAGTHDFKSFTVADPEVSSTVRTVRSISVATSSPSIVISIEGDGFLRNMVRRIAGSLIEVGSGRLAPEAVRSALEPAFAPARWTAPAKGLTLVEVRYEAIDEDRRTTEVDV